MVTSGDPFLVSYYDISLRCAYQGLHLTSVRTCHFLLFFLLLYCPLSPVLLAVMYKSPWDWLYTIYIIMVCAIRLYTRWNPLHLDSAFGKLYTNCFRIVQCWDLMPEFKSRRRRNFPVGPHCCRWSPLEVSRTKQPIIQSYRASIDRPAIATVVEHKSITYFTVGVGVISLF